MRNGHLIAMEGPVAKVVRQQSCLLMDAAANNSQWKLPSVSAISLPWDDSEDTLVGKLESGAFGTPPNVYEASMVYLMDIWNSFRGDWKADYDAGGLVITENYVTRNFLQQGSRIPMEFRQDYNRWLIDTAYVKLHLPAPDTILYLDVPVELRVQAGGASVSDDMIQKEETARAAELEIASSMGWLVVDCSCNGKVRAKNSICNEICTYANLLLSIGKA